MRVLMPLCMRGTFIVVAVTHKGTNKTAIIRTLHVCVYAFILSTQIYTCTHIQIHTYIFFQTKSPPSTHTHHHHHHHHHDHQTLMMIPSTTLLDFRIGLVPFLIMFDAPVEVKADLQLNAQGEATAGVCIVCMYACMYVVCEV